MHLLFLLLLQRIPSLFMEQHGYRIDDKVTLEGPTGFSCQVPLLAFNNAFGLRSGFREFSDYHGIQSGDSVLFNLTRNSHFVLKIYGKQGCQKTVFPGDMKDPDKHRRTFNDSPRTFSKHPCCVLRDAADSHESDPPASSDYRKKLRNRNPVQTEIAADPCNKLQAARRKRKVPEQEEAEEEDASCCKRKNGGFTSGFRERPSGTGRSLSKGLGQQQSEDEEKLEQMQQFLDQPELFFERLPSPPPPPVVQQEKPVPGKTPAPKTYNEEGKEEEDKREQSNMLKSAAKPSAESAGNIPGQQRRHHRETLQSDLKQQFQQQYVSEEVSQYTLHE
jgi:hypothetical protein